MSTKFTASQFRALIDRVARVRDSLASCRNSEVLAETETLRRVTAELQSAQLLRANLQLETERRAMLDSVARTAKYRMDNRHSQERHARAQDDECSTCGAIHGDVDCFGEVVA